MRKRKKVLLGAFSLLLVLAAGAVVVLLWDMNKFITTPANQAFGENARYYYLTVESGASFDKVAEALFLEHGISSIGRFKLLGRWKHQTLNIKAGEFEFYTAWNPEQVLDQLVSGHSLLHRITIPEGLPWWEVARLLEEQGFARAEDFAQFVNDTRLMRRYGIPFANAEGFLYPETYMLNKGAVPTRAHAQSALHTMIQTFW
ncbi:MAG: endolytic transglycosylase MltG, partial [Deltaproteobacteria bacterium]|nr:endolytic transglycosylase MltG [Deltaproteobacteria bacterium]